MRFRSRRKYRCQVCWNPLLEEAANLPKIAVTDADLATVHRLADGTLSPLTGPMKEAAFNLVLDEKVVAVVQGDADGAGELPTDAPREHVSRKVWLEAHPERRRKPLE